MLDMNWVFEFGTTCFRLESHDLISMAFIWVIEHTCKPIDNSEGVRLHDVTHIARNETNLLNQSFESLIKIKKRTMIKTNQESKSKDARESHWVPGSRCQLFHQAFVPGWKIPSIDVDNQTFISASLIPFNVTFNLILTEVDLTWMWQTYKL